MSGLNENQDRALFNEISDHYARKDTYPPSSIARKAQTDILMKFVRRSHGREVFNNVLEIGCGHGANAMYLAPYYKKYLGLDYSEELIRIAGDTYANGQTGFICSNLKEYGRYHDHDLIVGVGVLHHITDLRETLKSLHDRCSHGAVLAFIEPQNGNPFIQFMRRIRKNLDKHYSEDQVFFSKKELRQYFMEAGFNINKLTYSGYFSVPFAQVMLKPKWIFMPVSRMMTWMDKKLSGLDSRLAWNMSAVLSVD